MTIEKVDRRDLFQLAALYEELMGQQTNMQKLRDNFELLQDNPDYHILVAKKEGRIIGSITGVLFQDLVSECNKYMLIDNVIVTENFRSNGIGRKLIEEIELIAQKNGCEYALLVSAIERKDAHSFYENIGYESDSIKVFKKYLKVSS